MFNAVQELKLKKRYNSEIINNFYFSATSDLIATLEIDIDLNKQEKDFMP